MLVIRIDHKVMASINRESCNRESHRAPYHSYYGYYYSIGVYRSLGAKQRQVQLTRLLLQLIQPAAVQSRNERNAPAFLSVAGTGSLTGSYGL